MFLENLFNTILKMSLTGSYVILFVVFARFFMKKLPKIYSYTLWSVVFFRLLCPFSFESDISLIPSYQEQVFNDIFIEENIQNSTEIITTDVITSNVITQTQITKPTLPDTTKLNMINTTKNLIRIIWILGCVSMLFFSMISLNKLKIGLKNKVHLYDNIYTCENLSTAFVLGVINPKIFLPDNLKDNEKEFILLHEQTHIKRFDNVFSILAFFTLSLHWFNPLVWVAFMLFNKDMEMSCDETVIEKLGCKKEYSKSLLSFAVGQKSLISPLAFSEGSMGDTKQRITNIVSYKQPTIWISIVTLLLVIFMILGLGSDSKTILDSITTVESVNTNLDYILNINSSENLDLSLNNAKISIGINSGFMSEFVPSTGDAFSSAENLLINSDGKYLYSVNNNSSDFEDKQLNFVISLDVPFSVITPSGGTFNSRDNRIYLNSSELGFDIFDSQFDITIIKQEIPEYYSYNQPVPISQPEIVPEPFIGYEQIDLETGEITHIPKSDV